MTLQMIASMPVYNPFLTAYQKQIAEKHLAGVKLAAIERFRHCVWMQRENYRHFYTQKFSRIFPLERTAKLYDITQAGLAFLYDDRELRLMGFGDLLFEEDNLLFTKNIGSTDVTVRDGAFSGEVVIVEDECEYVVNTNIKTVKVFEGGSIHCSIAHKVIEAEPISEEMQEATKQLPVDDSDLSDDEKLLLNKTLLETDATDEHLELLEENALYAAVYDEKRARIHFFQDVTTALFDYTEKKITSIYYDELDRREYICLHDNRVLYPTYAPLDSNFQISTFSRRFPDYTDFITVRDYSPNCVEIRREPGISSHFVDLNNEMPFNDSEICYRVTSQPLN